MNEKKKILRKQKKLRDKITKIGPFIEGSIGIVERICGNKNCQCIKKGKKHPAMFLTWKENKKTKTLYVPVSQRNNVLFWSENYKKLKKIIKEISELQKKLMAYD